MSWRTARRRALGQVVAFAERATPRLRAWYARLPEAAGVDPTLSDAEHERRLARYLSHLRERVAELPQPTVSLLFPTPDAEALASIACQVQPPHQLVLAGTPGDHPHPAHVAVTVVPDSGDLAARLDRALAAATGEYVAVVDAGDRWYPWALAEVTRAFALERALGGDWPAVAYGDARLIDEAGDPVGPPILKPGWSPLLLRSGNYLGVGTLVRRELALRVGGFRSGPDPVHDLLLRATATAHATTDTPTAPAAAHAGTPPAPTPAGTLPGLAGTTGPTAGTAHAGTAGTTAPAHAGTLPGRSSPAPAANTPAPPQVPAPLHIPHLLTQHREWRVVAGQIGRNAATSRHSRPGGSPRRAGERLRRAGEPPQPRPWEPPLPDPAPPVTVVVPTKDQAGLIERCLTGLLTATDYPALRVVVVDNGSTEPAALAVLRRAGSDARVAVLAAPGPFNFARLCNLGAELADPAGVVVLLNNDTEVITPGWLRSLVAAAWLPGVGAVGAQLRYPNGRIQHAGLAGMADAGTGHVFLARDPERETPPALLTRLREVLAVTGACLAIRTEHYRSVGGLDEAIVPNDSGDVDLCLRLRDAGLVSVYVPHAVLLHHESPSRGASFVDFERSYLRRRWPDLLLNDPYLNPRLARSPKMVPDPRFAIPDLTGPLFARMLTATGGLPPAAG